MIGVVFQPMRSVYPCLASLDALYGVTPVFVPHGKFFSSFSGAFEVVRSLRSQGYRAVVKVTNPHYSI